MKVSIILPNYNHSRYLKQRIDSILSQSFRDFELIILDDKSPDGSADVIEKYRGHEKISHIIYNDQNSGSTFKQWAKGFSLAQGEYIWIAESDDYADDTFVEMCVRGLDENPSASLCFSDSYFVDENGVELESSHSLNQLILNIEENENPVNIVPQRGGGIALYNGFELLRRRLIHGNYIYNASMALFRKSILAEVSPSYTTFIGCGDWVFWGEMIVNHDVARVTKKLNYFRQHSNKVSAKNEKTKNNFIETAKVRRYLLSLITSKATELNIPQREILRLQMSTIEKIFMHLSAYKESLPQHSKSVKIFKSDIKREFRQASNKYYLRRYKRVFRELFKREGK